MVVVSKSAYKCAGNITFLAQAHISVWHNGLGDSACFYPKVGYPSGVDAPDIPIHIKAVAGRANAAALQFFRRVTFSIDIEKGRVEVKWGELGVGFTIR